MKPIRPSQVVEVQTRQIPDGVFEIFNELISQNWDGERSLVKQDVVVQRVLKKYDIARSEIFDKRYLDVESSYRKAGWNVEYDKPGFNEDGQAIFTFTKRPIPRKK